MANGHEPNLPNVTRVVCASAGLVMLVVFALVSMYALLDFLNRETPSREPPSLVRLPPQLPATPQLNPDQPRQLQQLREREDEMLSRYEWVDRQQGIARIPIDRAMAILAERGLSPTPPKEATDERQSSQ
jgi:hypothetical protein